MSEVTTNHALASTRIKKALDEWGVIERHVKNYADTIASLRESDQELANLDIYGHGQVQFPRRFLINMLLERYKELRERKDDLEKLTTDAAVVLDSLFIVPEIPLPPAYNPHVLPENQDPNVLYSVSTRGWEHIETYMLGDLIMVRTGELPSGQQVALNKFMAEQTRPTIESEQTQDFIYLWDYERYLKTAAGNRLGYKDKDGNSSS